MDWFRCYSEFATDSKVQIMPEHMQRRLIMLFCLCSSNALATLHETEIAFSLRITEQELLETKALFIRKGFINDKWEIHNWNKRQYVSDSSTGRSRKCREKKRQVVQQQCNVAATPPDTDTDTDTDTEIKETRVKKVKSILPLPDWLPLQDWNDYLEMRNGKGRGRATNRAKQLVIVKLDELRQSGHDPGAILQQSIVNGWTSVFEIKTGNSNGYYSSKQPTAHDNFTAGIVLALSQSPD